ncbi:probable LRR receptor-like serine/threonine-protein kinase At5g48740 [Quercus robur]|uniref:probable LRR receptor-like serine/threonine-protein kinase At5g48740 n=1 Tax=Quercus robur TaxID=38942 RepID=UPI0021612AD3|nr:probable LRR receptor-like serine/threonine-protein kinase At5g48740 [Quercus robur]
MEWRGSYFLQNTLYLILIKSCASLDEISYLAFCKNLEDNKLQGTLPQSLNKESLEIRTSGNLCLSFSTMTCNDVSSNPSIETPQVTIFTQKKQRGHNHIAIIAGAAGGAVLALIISLAVFLYIKKNRSEVTYTSTAEMQNWNLAIEMRNWDAAKVFSYKEIKAATNNFKEVIGRGSFQDGKLVAVKVRFDKSQLGADSFINKVYLLSQIRHQNLVCLEGFCHESEQQLLVYEYLPGGSLSDHLYGINSKKASLSWVRRLKISVHSAKGTLLFLLSN